MYIVSYDIYNHLLIYKQTKHPRQSNMGKLNLWTVKNGPLDSKNWSKTWAMQNAVMALPKQMEVLLCRKQSSIDYHTSSKWKIENLEPDQHSIVNCHSSIGKHFNPKQKICNTLQFNALCFLIPSPLLLCISVLPFHGTDSACKARVIILDWDDTPKA